MKILVSAYACDPYRGSEPGIGWTTVCLIARKHDVCVLTDIHNKDGWDRGAAEGIIPANVRVRFLRDHSACSSNRLLAHMQSWMNYRSFNNQMLAAAREWHATEKFDLCHQVTIASWRMPSQLWRLPIPFVWGPIGGAGYIPPAFRPMLNFQSRAFERLRDANTWLSSRSGAFGECIRNSTVVVAANEETEDLLRPFRGNRPLIRQPSAFLPDRTLERFPRGNVARAPGPMRLFAGGNMEGRKGGSLALRAIARAVAKGLDLHYTIAGGGPEIASLKKLAADLGIESKVEFHSGYSGDAYIAALQNSDVYFLPSFRETTPVTLLEAILAGCVPLVADTGAQGEIARLTGGRAVPGTTQEEMIQGLADALIACADQLEHLPAEAAEAARKAIDYFSAEAYDRTLGEIYAIATSSR